MSPPIAQPTAKPITAPVSPAASASAGQSSSTATGPDTVSSAYVSKRSDASGMAGTIHQARAKGRAHIRASAIPRLKSLMALSWSSAHTPMPRAAPAAGCQQHPAHGAASRPETTSDAVGDAGPEARAGDECCEEDELRRERYQPGAVGALDPRDGDAVQPERGIGTRKREGGEQGTEPEPATRLRGCTSLTPGAVEGRHPPQVSRGAHHET